MRKKKKEEKGIALIPVDAVDETEDAVNETEVAVDETEDAVSEDNNEDGNIEGNESPEEPESESSALFGEYVAEENKWERKNRIREEKERAKQEKKRARYANVDDDTYESMKAGGARKFFGVLMLLILIAGIGSASLIVYRLVFAPSYAQVGEKEKNIRVEGLATDSDTSKYEGQEAALQGIATPSDLIDTWVEQPFTPATSTDAQTQDLDGIAVPSDDETQEVTD